MAEGGAVSEPATAKINLFLRVLRARPDGFHDIESLVQPVTLADGVQARPADQLSLTVVGEGARDVPWDEGNLVLRAAEVLAGAGGVAAGAALLLQKRIPVAAGLGGGSADAAATLRALDRLWELDLGVEGLLDVAATVGSDVPGLLSGGPALIGGRGDRVVARATPRTWWVLVTQPEGVAAGDAYRWWDEDGGVTGPSPEVLIRALDAGGPRAIAPHLFNDLEAPVTARRPDVAEARSRLLDAGALTALMCGSGPTVAGLARDGQDAEQLAAAVGGIAVASMSGGPRAEQRGS
ncbi:MAG: 4-(cytidine 5'-diphospho)-2-C-methyl-D-erythritol kinase [Actinomycetota bacterium]